MKPGQILWQIVSFCCSCYHFKLLVAQTSDYEGQRYNNLYRRHLEQMSQFMNTESGACEDFFQHACGNFAVAENSKDSTIPPFLYNREDRMLFFEGNHAHFGTKVGQTLSSLYSDCKTSARAGASQSQWHRIVREVNFLSRNAQVYRKWPLLRYQWQELQQRNALLDWVRLAAVFAAHGIETFFNIFFAERTIYIAPKSTPHTTLPLLKQQLRVALVRRHPQVIEIIASELWFFCNELKEAALVNELAAYRVMGDTEEETLLQNNTLLLLDTYFEKYFSTLNLTETEVEQARKIPIDVERMARMLQVLQRTDARIIMNYVLWQVHEQLRFDDCYKLTEEFEQLLDAEYWQWHVFEEDLGRDVAMATYLYHTTRFQRLRKRTLLSEFWDQFLQVRPRRKDLNVEQLVREYAHEYCDAQQLADSFVTASVSMQAGAFYANLLQLRRWKLYRSFYVPAVDVEDHNSAPYFLRQFLHFSILLLRRPLFHYFATQGRELWHDSGLLYNSDGLYTAMDCLQRQTRVHYDDESVAKFVPPLDALEVEQIYQLHSNFLASLGDYQFWLEGESFAFAEDFILEYFEQNSQRILFYGVAQTFCGRNDVLYKRLINRSFMNILAFQEAFNCSVDAIMNPAMKCMRGY